MRAKVIVCLVSLLIVLAGYSQQNMEFTEMKFTNEGKTVYFHISGLGEDEDDRQTLLNDMLKDPAIKSGRIFISVEFKTRCQLYLSIEIGPEYIRNFLQAKGYDYDFSTISVNGEIKNSKGQQTFASPYKRASKNFDPYKTTGDKIKDAENYAIAKEKWVMNNQKKYKKEIQNGTAKFPIVISKDEFNNYTPEKQKRLLAEPKKYIIK
ncbi:MAG TPA: hypothetical protein PLG05_07750 [Bacteroidales bacterium]|nr:hypothetical protein [Bacteroidales bacterium]HPL05055.1 hypothetical protein [Bacteroidales bacterium]